MKPRWPVETERLVLRPFTEDDFDAMFRMHADAEVARWLYNEPRTPDNTRELLARKVAGSSSAPRTSG